MSDPYAAATSLLFIFLIPVATLAQAVTPISTQIIPLNHSVDGIVSRIRSSDDSSSANAPHVPADIRRGGTICAPTPLKNRNNPLIILDGRAIPNRKLQNLNPDNIENIIVINGEKAISKYGSSGKNGVLVITPKRTGVKNKKGPLN